MKVIIVESPTKVKILSKYFPNYKILATGGHIFDLKKSTWDAKYLGINTDSWEPDIEIIKNKSNILKTIKKSINFKNDDIIFATDNDREGEAISYYLAKDLGIDVNVDNRAVFNEISKDAIRFSLSNLQKINLEKVSSQKARRMIDRIVGILTSHFLQKVTHIKTISAGRVQSVALKLICERDKEIENYKPIKYYNISCNFASHTWKLFYKNKIDILSEKDAKNIHKILTNNNNFYIYQIISSTSKGKKAIPYKTSKLIRDSYNILGFSTSKTMSIAQALYEGKYHNSDIMSGLITYMRTDSINFSNNFIEHANNYVEKHYKKIFLKHPKNSDLKISSAHECIRTVSLNNDLKKVKKILPIDDYRLYELIYKNTIRCFTKPPIIKTKKFRTNTYNDAYFEFVEKSYDKVNNLMFYFSDPLKNETKLNLDIEKNTKFVINDLKLQHLLSSPPPHYNQASIIKKLETLNIGRPSTYGKIIPTLIKRNYVSSENKKIFSTIKGVLVNKLIQANFNKFINENFTMIMENNLDEISYGKSNYKEMVKVLYNDVTSEVKNQFDEVFSKDINIQRRINKKCPKCGGELILRFNYKFMKDFIGCENYFDDSIKCNYTSNLLNDENNKFESKKTDIICEKCGKNMVTRFSPKRNSYFIACSGFPKCKQIFKDAEKTKLIINKYYSNIKNN